MVGEITDNQEESWRKAIEVFDQGDNNSKQMLLYPDDQARAQSDIESIQIRLNELFSYLRNQWQEMFKVSFDILLYDFTSTYFECAVPGNEGIRKYGHSRDAQVIIALVITQEGFPLAYEVMPGNTKDSTTLTCFLKKIETQYGKANRTWLMDRGIPTEDTIAYMKKSDPPINYLIGTPKGKLREVMKREGKYILRSNLTTTDPRELWQQYMLLTEVEQAFKELKGDLSIRPIHHQKESRIEAHIFVAFQAYGINVTLKEKLKRLAPGLTPRAVIEKFKKIQMVDVHLPTTEGRNLLMSRYTQPEKEHKLLLEQMGLKLPK